MIRSNALTDMTPLHLPGHGHDYDLPATISMNPMRSMRMVKIMRMKMRVRRKMMTIIGITWMMVTFQ